MYTAKPLNDAKYQRPSSWPMYILATLRLLLLCPKRHYGPFKPKPSRRNRLREIVNMPLENAFMNQN